MCSSFYVARICSYSNAVNTLPYVTCCIRRRPLTSELTTSDFAGIVCVAGEPQGDKATLVYYDECRYEHNSNGGVDYDSLTDSGCWARGGRELWRTDGTMEGTQRVRDTSGGGGAAAVSSGMRGSDPMYITSFGGNLYYSALTDAEGRELWKSDGNLDGAVSLVKDINNGVYDSGPKYLVECNGLLFFSAYTVEEGRELWKSDGTASGTALVMDIRSGVGVGSDVKNLACLGTTLFFSAKDGTNGAELWKSDGSSTSLVKDIWVGADSSNPEYLTVYGSLLYFAADTKLTIAGASDGVELWKSDGTTSGTVMISIREGSGGSYPRYLTPFTSKAQGATEKLFFLATDGKGVGNLRSASSHTSESQGMQLWVWDGTSATRGEIMQKVSKRRAEKDCDAVSYTLIQPHIPQPSIRLLPTSMWTRAAWTLTSPPILESIRTPCTTVPTLGIGTILLLLVVWVETSLAGTGCTAMTRPSCCGMMMWAWTQGICMR